MREVMSLDVGSARAAITACLLDGGGIDALSGNVLGYGEIVMAVDPPLDAWFSLLESMPYCLDETSAEGRPVVAHFNLLGELLARRHGKSLEFALRHLATGSNWRKVMSVSDPDAIGEAAIRPLIVRMTDDEIDLQCDLCTVAWRELARTDSRVRDVLVRRAMKRAGGRLPSMDDYKSARTASARWRFLEGLIAIGHPDAPGLIVDGLWDACDSYRARCVEHTTSMDHAVMARIRSLADCENHSVRDAARWRLARRDVSTG